MASVEDLGHESSIELLVGVADILRLDEDVRPQKLGIADGMCSPLDGVLLEDRAAYNGVQTMQHDAEYFRVLQIHNIKFLILVFK